MFTHNLLLKLTAIAAAILIWVAFMLGSVQKRNFSIPVQFSDLPEELTPAENSPKTVTVRLEGRGIDLIRKKLTDARYYVDASGFRYGDNTVDLDRKNLVTPGSQNVDFAGDRRVTFNMDWIRQQKIPVEVQYASAKDKQFFTTGGYHIDPAVVTVRGPEQLLTKLGKITTEPVDKGMLKDKRVLVTLKSPGNGIELTNPQVILTTLPSSTDRRTLPMIPILQTMASNFDLVPKNVTVVVEGNAGVIQNLTAEDIVVRTVGNPVRDNEMLDLAFETPNGVQVVDYTPKKVQAIQHDTNSRR